MKYNVQWTCGGEASMRHFAGEGGPAAVVPSGGGIATVYPMLIAVGLKGAKPPA